MAIRYETARERRLRIPLSCTWQGSQELVDIPCEPTIQQAVYFVEDEGLDAAELRDEVRRIVDVPRETARGLRQS